LNPSIKELSVEDQLLIQQKILDNQQKLLTKQLSKVPKRKKRKSKKKSKIELDV
jgi:hypothetical protein